jgi:hypothetical protein
VLVELPAELSFAVFGQDALTAGYDRVVGVNAIGDVQLCKSWDAQQAE